MTELIKINYDNPEKPVVSGRELHEALGIKTAYKDWFPRMCEYGFEEEKDYSVTRITQMVANRIIKTICLQFQWPRNSV